MIKKRLIQERYGGMSMISADSGKQSSSRVYVMNAMSFRGTWSRLLRLGLYDGLMLWIDAWPGYKLRTHS